jgi:hypothetical protein
MLVFQWSSLGELVYVMEWIHGCCVYEKCESWFLGMVGANTSREHEDGVIVKLYETWLLWKKEDIFVERS